MHFLASSWVRPVFELRVSAPVGQASMQRMQVPQGWGGIAAGAVVFGTSASVMISASRT